MGAANRLRVECGDGLLRTRQWTIADVTYQIVSRKVQQCDRADIRIKLGKERSHEEKRSYDYSAVFNIWIGAEIENSYLVTVS